MNRARAPIAGSISDGPGPRNQERKPATNGPLGRRASCGGDLKKDDLAKVIDEILKKIMSDGRGWTLHNIAREAFLAGVKYQKEKNHEKPES